MQESNNSSQIFQTFFKKYKNYNDSLLIKDIGAMQNDLIRRFGSLDCSIYCEKYSELWENFLLSFIDEMINYLKDNNRIDLIIPDNQMIEGIIAEVLDEAKSKKNPSVTSFEKYFEQRRSKIRRKTIERWNNEAELLSISHKCNLNIMSNQITLGYSHYIYVGIAFVEKASKLIQENDENSYRLAIINVYHGLEFMCYGFLEDPKINESIYDKSNQKQTIGLDRSIDCLKKRIEDLEYRSKISRLKYLRNEVVHKAISISKEEGLELINVSVKFVNNISNKLWEKDLISTHQQVLLEMPN